MTSTNLTLNKLYCKQLRLIHSSLNSESKIISVTNIANIHSEREAKWANFIVLSFIFLVGEICFWMSVKKIYLAPMETVWPKLDLKSNQTHIRSLNTKKGCVTISCQNDKVIDFFCCRQLTVSLFMPFGNECHILITLSLINTNSEVMNPSIRDCFIGAPCLCGVNINSLNQRQGCDTKKIRIVIF